jgi:hypothetical protein
MGAILTDMLGTIRGASLASTATFSGGYFSDQDNVDTLGGMASEVSWPAPNHSNGYAQILLSGGVTDTYTISSVGLTVHFDTFAANDTAYLNDLGHDLVVCEHGKGHKAPVTGFNGAQVVEFFAKHPLGTVDSPYADEGLPADFPAYCTFANKK